MAPAVVVVEVIARDATVRRRLTRLLRQGRYRVVVATDLSRALTPRHHGGAPATATIVSLADRSDVGLLPELRGRRPAVIALARSEVVDVVEALDAGADDYVAEPVDPDELLARLRAVLRRRCADPELVPVVTPHFTLDLAQRRLTRGGQEVHLTPTEWRIIDLLAAHPDRLVSHDQMLRAIWGPSKLDKLVYLRVYVAGLRRKLEPDRSEPVYLLTEAGYGYRFRPGGHHSADRAAPP